MLPVRRQLRNLLEDAMLKCFPLHYITDRTPQPSPHYSKPSFRSLSHMSPSVGHTVGNSNKSQTCDYFSCSPQLIFDAFVTAEMKEEGNRGFYLLPTAKEVANDLTVQMMSPGSIASMMEVNQFFFG